MTQTNLIELAKQADAQAIADIISYLMRSQGVTARWCAYRLLALTG